METGQVPVFYYNCILLYSMNKVILLLLLCFQMYSQDNAVHFSGQILNRFADTLTVTIDFKPILYIPLKDDGTFNVKFKIEPGIYRVFNGKSALELYFDSGHATEMYLDFHDFPNTRFEGDGKKENAFLVNKLIHDGEFYKEMAAAKDDPKAYSRIIHDKIRENERIARNKSLNARFRMFMDARLREFNWYYGNQAETAVTVAKLKGERSPRFSYKNIAGETIKLDDFRGKYVYIDVWATWCGPCREEIPHLEKLMEKYKDKNIAFISISIEKRKDYIKWERMVIKENMKGIQLIADNDWKSGFIVDYAIHGIPRFILIDPKGIIIDASAEKPSDPALAAKLDQLLK